MVSSSKKVSIVKATEKDMPEVAKLSIEMLKYHNTLMDNYFTIYPYEKYVENFQQKLKDGQYILVAKIDNKIVGFASIWFSVDDAHITNIAVHNNHRKQGIASRMLERIISIAKEHNKTSLTLEVNIKNTIAQKLYLKYGFKNLGIRKNYYNGTDDAYIMTLYFNN